jgi:hypothetical protein
VDEKAKGWSPCGRERREVNECGQHGSWGEREGLMGDTLESAEEGQLIGGSGEIKNFSILHSFSLITKIPF